MKTTNTNFRVKKLVLYIITAMLIIAMAAMLGGCKKEPADQGGNSSENGTEEEYTEGLEFTRLDDGNYSVSVGTATDVSDIIIPENYNGGKVVAIAYDGFSYCENIKSIEIPDSVTSIGDGAFSYCYSLSSVPIPNSITSIGSYAFSDCASLTSITIPNGVTKIDDYTFYHCTSLTSITIPDSVTSIGWSAFEGCSSLTDVYYTGSEEELYVLSIGKYNEEFINATIHFNYVP